MRSNSKIISANWTDDYVLKADTDKPEILSVQNLSFAKIEELIVPLFEVLISWSTQTNTQSVASFVLLL